MKTKADKALEFLTKFVDANRKAIESDEEINGADCVDFLCQHYYEAKQIVGAK